MESKLKVYDYNGVLVSVDGFKEFLRENHPQIYDIWVVQGAVDPEVKRAAKGRVNELFETANREGSYPISLMPHVKGRLQLDNDQGYQVAVFTTCTRELVEEKTRELGIRPCIHHIISLDELISIYNIEGAIKEDPRTFAFLMEHLSRTGADLRSYADDSEIRIQAMMQAKKVRSSEGKPVFENAYWLASTKDPSEKQGYRIINDIMLAE